MKKYNVIGVMSGTSMDGLDLAHVTISEKDGGLWDYEINQATTIKYGDKWRLRLSKLRHQNSMVFYKTDRFFGHFIAESINAFIKEHSLEVDLISSHGHTIFHQPENNVTLQIGDGNAITALTGIPVVNNFRAIDVILDGEGAPLTGLADKLMFGEFNACVNLGGFANISADLEGQRIAYDVAPCNILLNRVAREFDQEYDEDGKIAEQGNIDYTLLSALNAIEYYTYKHPKSLGREWISQKFWHLVRESRVSKEDKMKTLVDHIAQQLGENIEELLGDDSSSKRVFITGGGALNKTLIDHIKSHTDAEVVVPDEDMINYKECLVFALLGVLRIENKINVNASATGAIRDTISGAVYGDFSKLV